jgi:hypothetical protein
MFLKESLIEVLNHFGISTLRKTVTIRSRFTRALGVALLIPARALGMSDAETTLLRLAYSQDFYRRVQLLGFETALRSSRKELRIRFATSSQFEIFSAAAGGVFSIYAMWELAQLPFEEEELGLGELPKESSREARELPEREIRRLLIEDWRAKTEVADGEPIAENDADYRMIRKYYDTLNVDVVRKLYTKVSREKPAD